MVRRQRDPALELRWRERLASWVASGLSVRAFCRGRGLVETAFYYWKRQLRARDAAVGKSSTVGASSAVMSAAVISASESVSASAGTLRDEVALVGGRSSVRRGAKSSSSVTMSSRSVAKTSSPKFAPVTVIPSATLSVEVRCPSGHVVVLSSCDAASLADLFAALEPQTPRERERQPC